MEMIKTYSARYLAEFCTSIPSGGKEIRITFRGGKPWRENDPGATFVTRDIDMQKAIEASPLFGKKIFLVGEEKVSSLSKDVNSVDSGERNKDMENTKGSDIPGENSDPTFEDKEECRDELIFPTLKELQVYLQKEYKVSFTEIRSKEGAFSKAEELGVNFKIEK